MSTENRNFDGATEHRSANDLAQLTPEGRNAAAVVVASAPEFELTAVAELGYD